MIKRICVLITITVMMVAVLCGCNYGRNIAPNAVYMYETETLTRHIAEVEADDDSVVETTIEETTAKEATTQEETTAKVEKPTQKPTKKHIEKQTEPATTAPSVVKVDATLKGTHYIGDTLTGADFTIVVTMSDGKVFTNPNGWVASPLYLGSSSTEITVSYNGIATKVVANVSQKPVVQQTQPQTEAPSQTVNVAGYVDSLEAAVIAKINEYRMENGLGSLASDSKLTEVARVRAKDIVSNMSHQRADGSTLSSLLRQKGYSFALVGENLARYQYTVNQVTSDWINSAAHRNNILGAYTKTGVGVYKNEQGDYYWVQIFAK